MYAIELGLVEGRRLLSGAGTRDASNVRRERDMPGIAPPARSITVKAMGASRRRA
jgi:hypothetical protein